MRRRRLITIALALIVLLAAALLLFWLVRFRVAGAIVDRQLAKAQVPASYRITRIGPFLERMEDVRLGNPAAPDLIARRIDVTIGYGFSGPAVRAITVDGVRLRGGTDGKGFSFGTLDRLLPKSGGKPSLPDMMLSLSDAELALATPAGEIRAAIDGEGNPARRFTGSARVAALTLRAGGCAVRDIGAMLKIASKDGALAADGPIRVSGIVCPARNVVLGPGVVEAALSSDVGFERLSIEANYAGFGGRVRSLRFASTKGAVSGSRSASGIGAKVHLNVLAASAPDLANSVKRAGRMAEATPLEAIGLKAARAFSDLLSRSDADADLTLELPAASAASVRVHRLALSGEDGAQVIATERKGISWTEAGLRTDADVTISGGALPALRSRLAQSAAGAPLSGIATLLPYRAANSQLAATPVRFGWDGRIARFATVVTLDGPVADGFLRGLTFPLRGEASATGALTIDRGCTMTSFQQLRLASFVFAPARLPVCGSPILSRSAGALQVDARSGPLRLSGRTVDGAPLLLEAATLRVTQHGFAAGSLTASLGGVGQRTRFTVRQINGVLGSGSVAGQFADASGSIGNVPLAIGGASGRWTFGKGVLGLSGNLRISDMAGAARFNPLATEDARLTLRRGVIAASATLREPATRTEVATVELRHDLSRGSGQAVLAVPGITFSPKRLQPEQLTSLTLGVVANVAGTVAGSGRIDWNAKGVTSSGTFGTDRLDLAAAFGPVTGIKGQLHFTDLLGLVSAPHQEATIAEVNTGVQVADGVLHYQLTGQNRVHVEDARWPFAGGTLRLEPSLLDFSAAAERHLTFRIEGLDAAAFIQQLDFPNISATGTFDGKLPMIFDAGGGRIEGGSIVARGPGTLAYVGELSNAQLGTMGKLAFDALKAIRYSSLDISLDGHLDGEMVSRVRFLGVREATPEQSIVTRLIRNLPFRFNIAIRAPFRGLVGSARAYINPALLLNQVQAPALPAKPIQPPASGVVR